MSDVILTHATEDRGWRKCQCATCGAVDTCTPNSDFFTMADPGQRLPDPIICGKPLLCTSCFFSRLGRAPS